MKRLLSLVVIGCLLVTGCSLFKSKENKTAQELISEGMEDFSNKKYRASIESFQKLKDWYPFSKYAILAELKLADAYYQIEEYDKAIAAYESFETLHPRNEATPYVIFQQGICYIHQMETIDRDQKAAKNAIDVFQRLKRQFPDDPYAKKADEYLLRATRNIVAHEFLIGEFYFKSKRYRAAAERFRGIITQFTDMGFHQKALEYLSRCDVELEKESARK
ncbi:MAG: outer membrane protein assembly factor BamD [Thermodesulfobacteriota bacterium]